MHSVGMVRVYNKASLQAVPNAVELNLDNGNVGAWGPRIFTEILPGMRQIQVVNLRRNYIQDNGMTVISSALRSLNSLRSLILRDCAIGNIVIGQGVARQQSDLARPRKEQVLCHRPASFAKTGKDSTRREFYLIGQDPAVDRLATRELEHWQNLEELNLRNNRIHSPARMLPI